MQFYPIFGIFDPSKIEPRGGKVHTIGKLVQCPIKSSNKKSISFWNFLRYLRF